jgi:hypothetical protein
MTQIVQEESQSSELEYEDDSHTSPSEILNPYDEDSPEETDDFKIEKTLDDFHDKIDEFDTIVEKKVHFDKLKNQIYLYKPENKIVEEKEEEVKSWMDTIIDNKSLIFTTINVLSVCYGVVKFSTLKKQQIQLSKDLFENVERVKELDLNLFRIEEYTKYLLKQQNKWVKKK